MSREATTTAVLVVGHGSPRPQANQGFIGLVGRIAARLEGLIVLPTFFSIAQPSVEVRVAELAARGVRRIVLMPYFLYSGQHVTTDIPALLDRCRQAHPGLSIEVLATLENEPAIEEVVVDRLASILDEGQALPTAGAAIEQKSFSIIEARLKDDLAALCPAARAIVRRVVHATADFSFARSLRIHPEAAARGLAALAAGRPIICDVKMLAAAITRVPNEVVCAIGEPAVIQAARDQGCTRAAIAMDLLADRIGDAIVVIGNAPTALWRLMELARNGGPRPALVAGLPVGFVGAAQSKKALLESGLCYVTNVGPRGGSPVAAAVVNALAVFGAKGRTSEA